MQREDVLRNLHAISLPSALGARWESNWKKKKFFRGKKGTFFGYFFQSEDFSEFFSAQLLVDWSLF